MASDSLIPKEALVPETLLDEEHATRFSAHLTSMKEVSLRARIDSDRLDEVFRVIYFPTFTPVISIRIERRGQSRRIHCAIGKGRGGYEPEGLRSRTKYKLSAKLWWEAVEWRDNAILWTPGTFTKIGPDGQQYGVIDGHSWWIEYANRESYKASVEMGPDRREWLDFEQWGYGVFNLFGLSDQEI